MHAAVSGHGVITYVETVYDLVRRFFLARPSVGWKTAPLTQQLAPAAADAWDLNYWHPRGGYVIRRGEELSSRAGGSGRRPGAENSVARELAEL